MMPISSQTVVQVSLVVYSLDVIIVDLLKFMLNLSMSMDSTQFVVKLNNKLLVRTAQAVVDSGTMDILSYNDKLY